VKTILHYLKPYTFRIIIGLSIKTGGTMIELVIPYILSHLIDDVAPTVAETKDLTPVILWGLVMIGCSLLAWIGNVTANRMASRVASWSARNIRHDLFEKISYLSCRKSDEFTIPSLISRLSSDTYNVHQFTGMIQRMGIRAPILTLGGLIITATLDPVLTLVLLAVMPFVIGIVFLRIKKGAPLFRKVQVAQDDLVRKVRENITGVRVIKALSKTDYEVERFDEVNKAVVSSEMKANMVMMLTGPAMNLFLNIGITACIVVGAYRVNAGTMKVGVILAFLSYFTIILNALMSISRIFTMYTRASASGDRIAEVLDCEDSIDLEDHPSITTDAHIVFDHVSFSYNGVRDNLSDVSFELKKGQTLGLIGPTGSGKTTLIQLLMRFYDVESGHIYIDGRELRTIPPEELHTMFGVVFQNDALFADTLRENIDFGRVLSDDNIAHAAECAQAKEFIDSLEEGYTYPLAIRGMNLSGGQRQRVLISRALAGDPKILILDDSSSALDYKTDASLRQAIDRDYKSVTRVVVAQRVSSIKNADLILVIEEGQIIGRGRHDDLLKTCPSYKEISDMQMGDESHA